MSKTKVTEFIKYLEDNNLATARLLKVLNASKDYGFFIEDISKKEFQRFIGAGKLTQAEFLKLKTEYLQKQGDKGYDEMTQDELIERIKELEGLLHLEKKRIRSIIEHTTYRLEMTIESVKSSAERYGVPEK